MKYYFVLGSNPALSVMEILSRLQPRKTSLIEREILEVDFDGELSPQELIGELGGTVKIARALNEDCSGDVLTCLKTSLPEKFEGKFRLGFSVYGKKNRDIKKIAMDVKKELKSRNISSSWVDSRSGNLSGATIEKNKLLTEGAEFVLIYRRNSLLLARTEAVQKFKELSLRDYGRPARDSKSGMIPPKLAQIMINIGLQGNKEKVLADPFCGSGTILMEAMLMGVKKIVGSDVSAKAITDTQKNIEWVKEQFDLKEDSELELFNESAEKLSEVLGAGYADLIVAEPYLGPQNKIKNVGKIKNELDKLYSNSIREFQKTLKKGGRAVMIWPVFKNKRKTVFLNPETGSLKITNPLPKEFNLKTTRRNTVVYGRKGQRVWREIVVLDKR